MTLGFLRHAEAEDGNGPDFGRRLTQRGIDQAENAGRFCLDHDLLPDQILTSPLDRARQTSEIVSQILECPLLEVPWLACGMSVEDCLAGLAPHARRAFVLLVGHEPDFSHAIAEIIGLPDPSAIKIRKASLTVVTLAEAHAGCGQLQFSIPSRLMKR